MKLAIRVIVLFVVVAGATAAATTSKATTVLNSHQSATASMPIPCGGPHMECVAQPAEK